MSPRRTTICCSALALALLIGPAPSSQSAPAAQFFPVRPVWTLALNNPLTTQPAFAGARGYFAIDGDRLVAYDLVRGEQIWLVPAATVSPPVAGGGLVFIVQSDAVTALNDRDGSEAWRVPFTQPIASRLAWDNGWLIGFTVSGEVLAFRALDGQLLWRHDAGARPSAPPALSADRVYVPLSDRRILALDVETGKPLWIRRIGGEPNEILALDDRIYAGASDNFLYCLEADTGRIDWRWRTGADVIGRPVADDRRVYFVSLDNMLRALNRSGGSQQWKRGLPMRPRGGPLLAGETLIVAGLSPALRAYSARTGAPAGELTIASEPAAPIHLVDAEPAPLLIAVTSDIAKGATVAAFTREIEPRVLPIAPLPNPTIP